MHHELCAPETKLLNLAWFLFQISAWLPLVWYCAMYRYGTIQTTYAHLKISSKRSVPYHTINPKQQSWFRLNLHNSFNLYNHIQRKGACTNCTSGVISNRLSKYFHDDIRASIHDKVLMLEISGGIYNTKYLEIVDMNMEAKIPISTEFVCMSFNILLGEVIQHVKKQKHWSNTIYWTVSSCTAQSQIR